MTSAEKFLMEIGNVDDEFIEEAMNFTMKKKFNWKPIIAVAACAAFALAAIPVANHFANNNLVDGGTTAGTVAPVPGDEVNFTVLMGGGSDADFAIEVAVPIETDFDGAPEYFEDKAKIGTNKTIEINGKTYTGVYEKSKISDYYKDDSDTYNGKVGDRKFTFSINKETGACTMFYITKSSLTSDITLTRDECFAKVNEYLKLYINDIESYELTGEYDRGEKSGYLFYFNRVINGIKTSDIATIMIRYSGEIYGHSFMFNTTTDTEENANITNVDIAKMNEAVNAKIKTSYKKYSGVKHTINNAVLTRKADGKYIMVYTVDIEALNSETQKNYFDRRLVIVEFD